MATGVIGTLAASASLSYTPASNAKVVIAGQSSGGSTQGIKINGQLIMSATSTNNLANGVCSVYVGAGQTITVATDANAACVVSSIEEN